MQLAHDVSAKRKIMFEKMSRKSILSLDLNAAAIEFSSSFQRTHFAV